MDDEAFSEKRVFSYVGQRLTALREGRSLRQQDVCKLIDVSHQQYQKYEDGSTKIALHRLLTLAQFYDAPIEQLIPPRARATPASKYGSGFAEDGQKPLHPGDCSPLDGADELSAAYLSISNPDVRRTLLALARSIANSA